MNIRLLILIIVFPFCNSAITAQDVQFTAQAKQTVAVGERFNLTYTVNANGTHFRGPQISDFSMLSGPNQSTSSSMQIIQGQITQSYSHTFTYIIQAAKEGTFTIPAATINVNGTDYQSNSININVVAGTAPQQQQTQPQQRQQQQQQSTQASGEEIFLRAFADKSNPMQGEQIIVTYKIYTSLPVSQYTIDRLASYSGFWSETLTAEGERPRQTNEVINGINYTVAEIRRIALFPQRSGQLTIAPLEVECIVQKRTQRQRQSVFDDFFFNPFFDNVQNVKMSIRSNPLTINVAPLPTQNRTSEFSGSVGSFTMAVDIDKTELAVNDALNIKVRISGRGNLRMVEEPKISFPPNLESYDAKVIDNISLGQNGISGSRTFEYLLIPRTAGEFHINPVLFSFFNPATKKYEILSSEPIVLNVDKGDGIISGGSTVSMVSREDVQYIGSDIRYLKTNIFPLLISGKHFYNTHLFWLLFLLPLLLFVLFIIIWRRQIKLSSNTALVRTRKATKMARKRLKSAAAYLKQGKHEAFYDEVSKALWGYLNYKFNVPYADLSKDAVVKTFLEKQLSSDLADTFIKVLDDCEFARFAPGDKMHTMETIYDNAINIITKIEKALK